MPDNSRTHGGCLESLPSPPLAACVPVAARLTLFVFVRRSQPHRWYPPVLQRAQPPVPPSQRPEAARLTLHPLSPLFAVRPGRPHLARLPQRRRPEEVLLVRRLGPHRALFPPVLSGLSSLTDSPPRLPRRPPSPQSRECPQNPNAGNPGFGGAPAMGGFGGAGAGVCYRCGQPGHISRACPQNFGAAAGCAYLPLSFSPSSSPALVNLAPPPPLPWPGVQHADSSDLPTLAQSAVASAADSPAPVPVASAPRRATRAVASATSRASASTRQSASRAAARATSRATAPRAARSAATAVARRATSRASAPLRRVARPRRERVGVTRPSLSASPPSSPPC